MRGFVPPLSRMVGPVPGKRAGAWRHAEIAGLGWHTHPAHHTAKPIRQCSITSSLQPPAAQQHALQQQRVLGSRACAASASGTFEAPPVSMRLAVPEFRSASGEAAALFAAATKAAAVLRGGGHLALIAGGWVRDALLARARGDHEGLWPSGDVDIATSALPDEVNAAFGACKPPMRARVVDQDKRVSVVVVDGFALEVTTFRGTDRRSPAQDAALRDFTCNALFFAWDADAPHGTGEGQGEVLDYVGGIADLERGVLRAAGVSRPAPSSSSTAAYDRIVAEDPVRALRACRFCATLPWRDGAFFRLARDDHDHPHRTGKDEETASMASPSSLPSGNMSTHEAVRAAGPSLALAPPERLLKELLRASCAGPGAWHRLLEALEDTQLAAFVFPEALDAVGAASFTTHLAACVERARALAGEGGATYGEEGTGEAMLGARVAALLPSSAPQAAYDALCGRLLVRGGKAMSNAAQCIARLRALPPPPPFSPPPSSAASSSFTGGEEGTGGTAVLHGGVLEFIAAYAMAPEGVVDFGLAWEALGRREGTERTAYAEGHAASRVRWAKSIARHRLKQRAVAGETLKRLGVRPGAALGRLLEEAEALSALHDVHEEPRLVAMLRTTDAWRQAGGA